MQPIKMHLNYKIAGLWFWPLARRVGFSPATSGRRNENDRPLFLYAELKTPVLRRIGRAAQLVSSPGLLSEGLI